MAELVDAVDLGSTAERRGGSSPSTRTIYIEADWQANERLLRARRAILLAKAPGICIEATPANRGSGSAPRD